MLEGEDFKLLCNLYYRPGAALLLGPVSQDQPLSELDPAQLHQLHTVEAHLRQPNRLQLASAVKGSERRPGWIKRLRAWLNSYF